MAAVSQALALAPVVKVYVCGWRTAAAGDEATTTLPCQTQQKNKHTSLDLKPGIRSIVHSKKSSTTQARISLKKRQRSSASICDASGISENPTPEGNLFSVYHILDV